MTGLSLSNIVNKINKRLHLKWDAVFCMNCKMCVYPVTSIK